MMNQHKYKDIFIVLSIMLVISFVLTLMIGQYQISLGDLMQTILSQSSSINEMIVFNIRLPRLIIVLFSGIALAISGSLLQSVSKNDLADPGVIGINAGAGLGVTIFFLLFVYEARSFVFLLPLIAFGGGLISALIIFALSYDKLLGIHPYKMILMGIGFSMAASGLMVLLITTGNREEVQFITNWLAGNVWGGDWPFVIAVVPIMILIFIYMFFQLQTLNVIQLGSQTAKGLGVNLKRKQFIYLLLATCLASLAVAVVGNIAFVGLLAPHISKRIVGIRNQKSIPITALIGANLLVISDLLARTIIEPNGIPTGIIVSMIGAPYFIYLIIKTS